MKHAPAPDALPIPERKTPSRSTERAHVLADELDYVYRALRRHGVSATDAEDLAQDVFVLLCRRWRDFDQSRPVRPWLAGITFKVAADYHRRSGQFAPQANVDGNDLTVVDIPESEGDQARRLVASALDRLPHKHRAMIVMHELEGIPMGQLAAMMSVPLFTAHGRMSVAKQAFARAVRALAGQPRATRDGKRGALLSAGQLLALEREAPELPVPPDLRARAQGRVHESPRIAEALAPAPEEGAAAAASLSVPTFAVAAGAGVVFALGILALVGAVKGRGGAEESSTTIAVPGEDAAQAAAGELAGGGQRGATGAKNPVTPAQLARGLIGHWGFEEEPERWAINDSSGRAYHCVLKTSGKDAVTAKGAASGVIGGALLLDGRRWLECPARNGVAALRNELTVALWARPEHHGARHTLVTRAMGLENKRVFSLRLEGGAVELISHVWKGVLRAPQPEPSRGWFHVAAVRDAAGAALYLDGVLVARHARPRPSPLGGGTASLTIGAAVTGPRASSGSQRAKVIDRFEGALDEVRIYDRALEPAEIAALARRETAMAPALAAPARASGSVARGRRGR